MSTSDKPSARFMFVLNRMKNYYQHFPVWYKMEFLYIKNQFRKINPKNYNIFFFQRSKYK